MFYGKGGATPAAGKHYDVPHAGSIPVGPGIQVPIIHGGPSWGGPAHLDVPHQAYGPFVHGAPEPGEFGKGLGKGFGKGVPGAFGKAPVGKGAKAGFGQPRGYGKGGYRY